MADEIKNLRTGIKTRLETITGLRVYTQPPESVQQFPAAVVLLERTTYHQPFQVKDFNATFRIILLVNKADDTQALDELDKYLTVLGPESVPNAIRGDTTLGGNATWAELRASENVGVRTIEGGTARYIGADFLIETFKRAT